MGIYRGAIHLDNGESVSSGAFSSSR